MCMVLVLAVLDLSGAVPRDLHIHLHGLNKMMRTGDASAVTVDTDAGESKDI